ncbi:MAG: tripartite tricarboxylate transporter permease [Rhodospirillaceae bacterium]|nr:tripartite tricarboxylate transporter permease [Rhodospirillaceae bacterium]MBT5456120.1 tripartite tricarboxylate transporter permease [Rhodospirillaceae bacterium]
MEAVLQGLLLVAEWPAPGWLVAGVLVGLFFGATPGLSGVVGLAILLPFTYDMTGASAFAFLLGMYAITTTSDTLASVLLGVPGTGASQATILDGYPLAMKGEAARAFGAAFSVSAFGGVLGAIVLGLSIPLVKPIIIAFASPEYFMLGVLGLTMVGSLSGNSVVKGVLAALIGLQVTTIGYSMQGGEARFHFGWPYLLEGVPLVPVVLGLFALPELINLAVSKLPISRVPRDQVKGGMSQGVRDACREWWLVLRSAALGMYIGVLPGLGGAIVDWVAYGHAVQSAKDKSQFGKGDIRGVIAPETANNAMKGGVLIPTVAFGIPGNAAMAIMLGAFVIQGLTPGVQMLESKLDITFSLIWILVFANVLGAGLLMVWGNQLCKLTFVPGSLLVPGIVLFVFMGAWMGNQTIGNWYVLLVFGVLGYLMKLAAWPRPPLVLGVVLGPIMENALDVSYQTHKLAWMGRPIVLIIAVLAILVFVLSLTGILKRKAAKVDSQADLGNEPESPRVSFVLAVVMSLLFAYTVFTATQWPYDAAFFPITVGIPAILLVLAVLFQDSAALGWLPGRANETATPWTDQERSNARISILMFGSLAAIVAVAMVVGQQIALCLFMFLFLKFWARESWPMIIAQTVAGFVILEFMFDYLIAVIWHPAIFDLAIEYL